MEQPKVSAINQRGMSDPEKMHRIRDKVFLLFIQACLWQISTQKQEEYVFADYNSSIFEDKSR